MDSAANHASMRLRLRHAFQGGLPISNAIEPHLSGALRDTLQHPGSMVRAELAYRVACSFRVSEGRSENLAIAIEYFHTASLIFDDLPSMDDAEMRRGVPCAHQTYGEGAAILAALALINRAYALVWKSVMGLPEAIQTHALSYLERYLGIAGLLNGQSQDLHYFRLSGREPQLIAMGKTVSLIRLSLVLPAIVGHANPEEVKLLDRLSVFWGLSYQTLDDLKDVLQTEHGHGKTAARDAYLDRPNLALKVGIPESFDRIERLMNLGMRVIARLVRRHARLAFLREVRVQFMKEIAKLSEASLTRAS
ncbi:MAG TPA: polyprenyl synthetase family protein [Terracidiphilus sp.]|jgi:geranylgeranyl pyrophosphate synthase